MRWFWVSSVVLASMVALVPRSGAEQAEILSFGVGANEINVVQHGELISIFANNVSADLVLRQLENIGGPSYASLEPLTRPVNLTMHKVTWEEMIRRMLYGYNCSFHYKGGRLARVRVLRMSPQRPYKTPRLLQSRSEWKAIELEELDAARAEE